MSLTRRALLAAPTVPLLLSQAAEAQCSGINMSVNGSSAPVKVITGQPIQIATFNGPANPNDFVGIAQAEAPPDVLLATAFLNGSATPPATGLRFASFTMTAPQQQFIYEVRFYFGGTFSVLAMVPIIALSA